MHKSAITFVVLITSLVMLSAMPLFNNNTVAMAQGYDNYGDSYYSQYPTDDKKYECRTGPFEGFFVSSVEFCKHIKFDDRKDRDVKVGPQGPPGVNGTTGATGATGPAGPPGIVNAELCPPGTAFENFYVLNGTTAESCDIVPPPPPPPPKNSSLTVNKQVFGCDNITSSSSNFITEMNCRGELNDSPDWRLCNSFPINNTLLCNILTEDRFDIEVLDEQDNQIGLFEGSVEGTSIDNLEPGTYRVNEIERPSGFDELVSDPDVEAACINNGFTDGGSIVFSGGFVYEICFEYEDEQGNDCNTITLPATEEENTCTVKNYILFGGELR
jgi:hypothetical protein